MFFVPSVWLDSGGCDAAEVISAPFVLVCTTTDMPASTLPGWKHFGDYRRTASGLWQGDCLHCGFTIAGSHTRFAGHFNPDDKATKISR